MNIIKNTKILLLSLICLVGISANVSAQETPLTNELDIWELPGAKPVQEEALVDSFSQRNNFFKTQSLPIENLIKSAEMSQTVISIVPQSATTVGNCFPFGSNSNFDQKFMGFVYRNVPAFTLKPGDQIAFDLGRLNDVDIRRTIFFAPANINPINGNDGQGVRATAWTQVVSESQTPLNPRGNTTVGDYELIYTAETAFTFSGGGFIIAFRGKPDATYTDGGCEQVLVATTINDISGNFYKRFYNLPDRHLGELDTGSVSRDSFWLGGFKIFSDNCDTVSYPNFSSTTGLQLNGNAAQSGNVLRLTPAVGGQQGSSWFTTKQSVQNGFETVFDFRITNPDPSFGGADGFTFTLQNSGSGASAIGTSPGCGSCLGYTGISNSLAVEFDALRNELRVATNGSFASIASTSGIPNLNDGNIHKAKVVYVPGSMTIFIDDLVNPRLTVNINISSLGLDNGKAFVGFTAATGGGYENHDILNWSFGNGCDTNTAPTAVADSFSTNEDTPLSDNVLTNDTDAENDTLTAVLVSNPSNAVSFMLNADGSFSYTPAADFNGTDSFTYKANDGQADSNTVTVTITVNAVNDAPMLSGVPASATIDELVGYNFTASASDVDSSSLQFSLSGAPSGAMIDPNTGAFSWTPTETQGPGSYVFSVNVSDGSASTEATINITVNEVNVAPQIANVPASATIDELVAYGFTATATDADIPANTLTFSLVGEPSGAGINSSTGQFSWTPAENQGPGTYNFTVRVSDGLLNSDAPISLTVNEVNSAPTLAAIADQTVDELTLLSVNLSLE